MVFNLKTKHLYFIPGAAEWLQTTDEVISSWKNISGLESGSLYEVRIIATTEGLYSASHIEVVRTKGISEFFWSLFFFVINFS